jgi:hypothetical protein
MGKLRANSPAHPSSLPILSFGHKPQAHLVSLTGTTKGAVMESETTRDRAMAMDEIWKWTVGAGILVVALAPLALPILILTIVALLPLAVPLLALGLVAGVIALPVILVRKLVRSVRGSGPRRRRPAEPAPKPATSL